MCKVLCHHRGRIKEDNAEEMTFDGLLRVEQEFASRGKRERMFQAGVAACMHRGSDAESGNGKVH